MIVSSSTVKSFNFPILDHNGFKKKIILDMRSPPTINLAIMRDDYTNLFKYNGYFFEYFSDAKLTLIFTIPFAICE